MITKLLQQVQKIRPVQDVVSLVHPYFHDFIVELFVFWENLWNYIQRINCKQIMGLILHECEKLWKEYVKVKKVL